MLLQFRFLVFAVLFLSISCNAQQTPKNEVINLINKWYEAHPKDYTLDIPSSEAEAKLENYHKDNPTKDLLRVYWKGMIITMSFKEDLNKIKWTTAELQKQFSYIVLDDIYNDIDINGWKIYPETPVSSTSEGVKFVKIENGELVLKIDWQMYTIFGYSQTEHCKNVMQITDTATPEPCYVGVRKYLPLNFTVRVKLPVVE